MKSVVRGIVFFILLPVGLSHGTGVFGLATIKEANVLLGK